MSDTNFDPSEENNWNEFPEESRWGEYQWRKYLNHSDDEIERFLGLYEKLKNNPNHFDEIASKMGWDAEDISLTDEFDLATPEEVTSDDIGDDDIEPYTPLSHPVIVVTHALLDSLRQIWESFIARSDNETSAKTCWQYASSLHQAEVNVLLAVHAIDLGDFGLTICHLKNSLSTLNKTFSLLETLAHPNEGILNTLLQETRIRLFDLRELWLRVMNDCRIECNRRIDNDLD